MIMHFMQFLICLCLLVIGRACRLAHAVAAGYACVARRLDTVYRNLAWSDSTGERNGELQTIQRNQLL